MSLTSTFSPPVSSIHPSNTATLRGTYIPPFATSSTFIAANPTTRSLDGSRPTPTAHGHPADPTTPAFQDDLSWITAYLVIHSLSLPNSYVYAFIFWFAIIAIFATMSILHAYGAKGGVLGAWWSKWALRRRTWRKKHTIRKQHRQPWSLPSNAQILAIVVLFLAVIALSIAGPNYLNPQANLFDLSLPHNDSSTISRRAALDPNVVLLFQAQYTINKSLWSSAARAGEMAVCLLPFVILLALKAPPFALFAVPFTAQLHFDKLLRLHRWAGRIIWLAVLAHVAMWCVELGRYKRDFNDQVAWKYVFLYDKFIFGWIAFFALTILCILSLQPVRDLKYQVFYVSHIVLTPMVLIFVAFHHPPVWWWSWAALAIWGGERIWRATAWVYVNGIYGIGAERQRIVPASVSAGHRSMSDMKSLGSEKSGITRVANKGNRESSADEAFEMSPISPTPRQLHDNSLINASNLSPPTRPSPGNVNMPQRTSFGMWDPRYLDREGAHTPAASIDSVAMDWDDSRQGAGTPSSFNSKSYFGNVALGRTPSPALGVGAMAKNAPTLSYPVIIPPGFAHATLLPGRTIRLRILPRGPFTWTPGQHVLICIPAVSKLSSHPFSIASVCDELAIAHLASSSHSQPGAMEKEAKNGGLGTEIGGQIIKADGLEVIVLVRAKKGWTRRLWQLVETMQSRGERIAPAEVGTLPNGYDITSLERGAVGGVSSNGGVFLRTLVDGAFGSTARARWGSYSNIVIVCGGSGVAFGMSILEYYCMCLAGRDGRFLGTKGRNTDWKTKRVRFIWLIREYSHLQWCASALRKCLALIPGNEILEVNIYVTNFKPAREVRPLSKANPGVAALAAEEESANPDGTLLPPAPRFARESKKLQRPLSSSSDISVMSDASVASEDSDNSYADLDYYFEDFGDHGDGDAAGRSDATSGLGHEEHALDYTNFDGDDDEPIPGELDLSRKVKKEGKLRREKTKKSMKSRFVKTAQNVRNSFIHSGPTSRSTTGPQIQRPSSNIAIEVYPETPNRASGLASDPLLASSSTSPPLSPEAARFSSGSESGLYHLQLPASSHDIASSLGDVTPSRGLPPRRPPLTRPESSVSIMSTTSSIDVRPPADRNSSTRWLDLAEGGRSSLTIDPQELQDIRIVSEVVRPGKPKLDKILHDEVEQSSGRIAVACCGPTSLNALMRKYVASEISPTRLSKGDLRGSIDFLTEDFEY